MPRSLEGTKPIKLRLIFNHSKLGFDGFQKMFADYGINASSTSLRYLFYNGVKLKRVDRFEEKIEEIININFADILKTLNMKVADIWEPLHIYKDYIEYGHDDDALLNKFMEVTMLKQSTMQFFSLKQNPFALDIKRESEIYLASPHAYALEVMRETAEFGGFGVITGQVGSGKTTVLSKFIEEIRSNEKYHVIYPESIDKTKLTTKGILQACVFDLSEKEPKGGIEALSRQVKSLLERRSENNDKTILIIEEAHDLTLKTLKELKRLWEMKKGLTRLLGIILVGQNELESRLYGASNTDVREVTARVTHAKVDAIVDEVQDYIIHRIKSAKGDVSKIIKTDAMQALREKLSATDRLGKTVSYAYPLAINNMMIKLMNYASDTGEGVITRELVTQFN